LGVDGLDIDVEQGLTVEGSPYRPGGTAFGLIEGLEAVLSLLPPAFMLTMAPETLNLVGALARYGGEWGNYLPLILHFYERITRVHMQYYNSGVMPGLDGRLYQAGSADFAFALTEALIRGFPIANTGVYYPGLPAAKIGIGLPASTRAAFNGYLNAWQISALFKRLKDSFGEQSGGLMTWSIQWDALTDFAFARNAFDILQ
jgi:chitinase